VTIEIEAAPVPMTPDGRLTTDGAAHYVGLSRKTMAQMRSEGRGPRYIKLGRVFYFREDLDEWLSQAPRVRSTAEDRLARSE